MNVFTKAAQSILDLISPSLHAKISRIRNTRYVGDVVERLGPTVLSGPFKGMRYIRSSEGSAIIPKIIGCYEKELHCAIGKMIGMKPDVIVDIGCAEGYYAVGMAFRLKESRIAAYDINPAAREKCAELARINGVETRIRIGAECTHAELQEVISGTCLVICDCEGYEDAILDPQAVSGLKKCDLIVEVHEFVVPGIGEKLKNRFESTHHLTEIYSVDRKSGDYPMLDFLTESEKTNVLSEWRPGNMSWLIMEAK